jgi:flagellar hook-associated protein 1 FlgK
MQNGSLNALAQSFADRVNNILTNGLVSAGPPPVPGVALFTYAAGDVTGVAKTLALNPAITAEQLAAISPGPPFVSNGAALELADMRNGNRPEDLVGGASFLDFYASQARAVGDELRAARQQESRSQTLLAQARDLRQQLSGVSLDEEAIVLTELQRSYEANAQVVKIVDELIQSVLSIIR